jgi:hypothetical protein
MIHISIKKTWVAVAVLVTLGALVLDQSRTIKNAAGQPAAAASQPASGPRGTSTPDSMPTSRLAATSAIAESGPAEPLLTYKCEKCDHEFTKRISDMPVVENTKADWLAAMKPDCPKCRAKNCCWREMECPNCHKMFVAASEMAMYETLRTGREPLNRDHDICPHCATDVLNWWKAHPHRKE